MGATVALKYLEAKGRASGLVLVSPVPPSGNGPMTGRFLLRTPGIAWLLTRGFAMKTAVRNPDHARRIFFNEQMPEEELKTYMEHFAADSKVGINLKSFTTNLPNKQADADGVALWVKRAPAALVVGSGKDIVIDRQGVLEMARFLKIPESRKLLLTPHFSSMSHPIPPPPPIHHRMLLFIFTSSVAWLGESPHDVMLASGWDTAADTVVNWIKRVLPWVRRGDGTDNDVEEATYDKAKWEAAWRTSQNVTARIVESPPPAPVGDAAAAAGGDHGGADNGGADNGGGMNKRDDACERRRRRGRRRELTHNAAHTPRAEEESPPPTQEAWLAEWSERLDCWWLALPDASRTQLGACLGALGLHVASRLDAAWRAVRVSAGFTPPSQGALVGAGTPEQGCEWISESSAAAASLPALPAFPSFQGGFEWAVPPIPRLLPFQESWQGLHSLADDVAAPIATRATTAASPRPRLVPTVQTQTSLTTAVSRALLGAAAGAGAAMLALGAGALLWPAAARVAWPRLSTKSVVKARPQVPNW